MADKHTHAPLAKPVHTGSKYDCLRLGNQLCFPLYACSKEIIRRYKPLLDKLDLTYTQYITMMVLWEHESMTVKELGEYLYLDSGTLTPVLKKLESKGCLSRRRSKEDERSLIVTITDKGRKLQDDALSVPGHILECVDLPEEDARRLYSLLYEVLNSFREEVDK
jgi:DNA-binding MarR family transcriptional regulator